MTDTDDGAPGAVGALAAIGDTPLVDLSGVAPAGGARLLAKWEGANPTGSMKDRMALAGTRGARETGDLAAGQRVVELTGGSTGSSLGLVCAALGHPLSLVSADCFAEEKIRTMRALGADVEVLETPEGKVHPGLVDAMEERALAVRDREDGYYFDQFNNHLAVRGYEDLAREVLEAAADVTDFVMAVGTGGCAMGASRGFRDAGADVRVTLVEPAASPTLSEGRSGSHGVEGIALGFRPPLLDEALFDDVLAVPEKEGRAATRRLAREEGLLVGASSGLNLAAARLVAADRGPDGVVVTVLVDTGLKYLRGDLFSAMG